MITDLGDPHTGQQHLLHIILKHTIGFQQDNHCVRFLKIQQRQHNTYAAYFSISEKVTRPFRRSVIKGLIPDWLKHLNHCRLSIKLIFPTGYLKLQSEEHSQLFYLYCCFLNSPFWQFCWASVQTKSWQERWSWTLVSHSCRTLRRDSHWGRVQRSHWCLRQDKFLKR